MEQIDRPLVLDEFGQAKGINAPAVEIAVADEQRPAAAVLDLGDDLVAGRGGAGQGRGQVTHRELSLDV